MQVHDLQEKGNLIELVDPRLGSNFKKREVMRMIYVALLCTNVSPASRPTMSSVVSMLEGKILVPSLESITIATNDKTIWKHMEHIEQVTASPNMIEDMSLLHSNL